MRGIPRVFKSAVEALRNKPHDEKDRFRLYEVTLSDTGEKRYVWERNPDMAIGRGARDLGVVAEVYGPTLEPDETLAAIMKLPVKEQKRLLEAVQNTLKEMGER